MVLVKILEDPPESKNCARDMIILLGDWLVTSPHTQTK